MIAQSHLLTHLQVSELSELLATTLQLTGEGLDMLMDDLVRANVAALSEGLAADVAVVWSLASVTTLVSLLWSDLAFPSVLECSLAYLQVSELGKSLSA